MFWSKREEPGASDRADAARCRATAKIARDEGDDEHARQMETMAELYEKDALQAVRYDRQRRAGAKPYSFNW